MISGPQFPRPDNEPEVCFDRGTSAANELVEALGQRDVIEIPTVIGGKRYFSNDVVEVRAPHDHQRLLARIHRPSEAQVGEAIASSKSVARDWGNRPFRAKIWRFHLNPFIYWALGAILTVVVSSKPRLR